MNPLHNEVLTKFGNQLRVRVCGLCRQQDQLLMVRHRGLSETNTFWSPPGGGVRFGETSAQALIREFSEETGLVIDVGELLFVNEFIAPPLHAVELFFRVTITGGKQQLGTDPELEADNQLIDEMKFMSFEEIKHYLPQEVHSIFQQCQSLNDLFRLRGYLN
ncbi:NUDIX hydrolase [Spirosoma sp. SC4-14]|uniref:NUDIX hydrolase n=1 Tax=Spirosoma sp. SC4-14 TaxID=3128900 RepID=UPI0030D4D616